MFLGTDGDERGLVHGMAGAWFTTPMESLAHDGTSREANQRAPAF